MATPSSVLVDARPVATTRKTGGVLRASLRFGRTRVGLVLVLGLGGIAVFGPLFAPHGPTDFIGQPNAGPSAAARFGTDYLGQDVWSRFLDGGFEILSLAVLATGLGLVLGTTLGMLAAYSRGLPDDVIMRIMDVILAFPSILLVLLAISILGASDWLIVLAAGLSTMPRVARVVRGASEPIVQLDFIAAAEALGVSRLRILISEVLPNILSPLMVESTIRLANAIGIVASIAFLGFTPNPNGADWGLMIQENQIALVAQPWGVVLPVAAVALLTMGTGLIGDGIARAAAGIDRAEAG